MRAGFFLQLPVRPACPPAAYVLALAIHRGSVSGRCWRTDVGIDWRLPWRHCHREFLDTRDVNGVYDINANLTPPTTAFTGADASPRGRDQPDEYQRRERGGAEEPGGSLVRERRGWAPRRYATASSKAAYSYGEAKKRLTGSSRWDRGTTTPPGRPEQPAAGVLEQLTGHRGFVAAAYTKEWIRHSATTVSAFWEARTIGNTSYTFSGDLNGDGGTSNDLIYVPRDTSEMNFQTYSVGAKTFTSAEQAQAWDAYISADKYLSKHRGEYAERGAVFLPFVRRMDLSIGQDVFGSLGGARNSFQVRLDILNFGNLLNQNWGVSQRIVLSSQPLIVPTAAQGGRRTRRGARSTACARSTTS